MKNFFDEDVSTTLNDAKNKKKLNSWWVERYRPLTMDDFIGNESIKKQVKKDIDNQDISHILLHGRAGSGKTTLAKILSMNISSDRLYINASDENSVDDIRTKVKGFASSVGYVGKKIIVLDECLGESTIVHVLRNGKETSIQIKDLDEKTDLVKSLNIETNEIQYRPFDLHNIGQSNVYEMELENGEKIICTDTHKWYVEDFDGNLILAKTEDIITGKYTYILTP